MIAPRRVLVLCLLAACGPGNESDDIIDAPFGDPTQIPGGGVANPGITGVLDVFAVDAITDLPIAGAVVRVETAPALEATTDGAGLARFADGALAGAQTVSVTAAGHVATTWIGVAGRDVTIPLAPTAAVPTAHVSGTIAGWNALPAPAFDHYTLGLVLTSFTDDVSGPENNITQPAPGGQPANTCLRSALSNTCAWQLETRTGRQLHFAVIVDGNPMGTSDPLDDTYTLIGYAVGDAMTLAAGQQVSNESLTILGAAELMNFNITLPAAPAGLTDVLAIPMLDLGDDGRIVFPLPTLTPSRTGTRVIASTGRFTGPYDLVAIASPPGTSAMPYSTTFGRSVAVPGTIAAAPWLAPPSAVDITGADISFTAPATPVRYATIRAGGSVRWSLSLLDGSSSFQLPQLATDPLPTGALTLEIAVADLPPQPGFNAGDFRVRDLQTVLVRASGSSLPFSR